MTTEQYDNLDAEKLDNGKYVWTWTSPGGAAHQGAKHYTRKADAIRAGQQFLATITRAAEARATQQRRS